MVAPGLPKWSHRALSRARCEVARLEALRVLRFDEAACLRLAIAVRERELPVREADLGGASALCSLLQELAEAGDETRLSPAVIERLAEHYAPRRPDLAHLLDPLASRPAGAVPPAPPVSPPEKAVDESPPAAPASAEALPAERLAAAWSLARFLEAVNIGWGMLAASLLIVGCSIALVITLWQSNVPVIRYLAFLGVALGLNGVGQFAHRRLRLAITGHTVLAVSMLLMPLNLVAAEVLGGAAGRAVSPAASAMILLGFAAVAWSSLRLVCPAGAVTASVTFAVLIGLELAVEPLRAHGAVAELAVAWAGTAVYLAGLALTFRRRRSAGAVGPAPVVFTGGVLAFAHLVLWARVHLDGLGQGQFDRIAPVVVLYLLAGLCIGRELRRVAVARAWARPAAAALDTLAHLAVPLVLLVMAPANGGRLLVSSLAALALYGTVAGWYRSRLAAGAAAAATVVAGYAGLTLLHEWSRGEFSWLPVSWPQLAFEMLPLVAAFLIAGEALARRRRGDSATAAAWAAPVLLGAGGVLATLLLGAMIPDGPRLGEAVALVGGLALILALGTRRRAYAHAALAALPIVLALRPGVVADLVEAKTLVVWLGAVGILYFAAGSRLARDRVPLAATFARPFVVTALLLMPPILLATFLPEITGLSVVGPLACLLLCAGAAGIRPAVHLAELAGAFYVLAAGLAIHHWVAPIADPVPASVAWALAAAVPLLALGLVLGRRGGARAQMFGLPAVGWGIAVVLVQPMAYALTPTVTITAVCAGVSALLLLVVAGVERRRLWTGFAAGFLGLTAFFVYHRIDPIGAGLDAAPGAWAGLPTWLPLAPLFTGAVLLGGAALSARGWRRSVFARPLVVASIVAVIATVCLTLWSPVPARKAWTLALALLPLVAIHFRLTRQPLFLLGFIGLAWQAMLGLVLECIGATTSREGAERFSAILAGTAAVAAIAVGIERGLEVWSHRPAPGAWLRGVRLGVLPVASRVLGLGTALVMALVAVFLYRAHEYEGSSNLAWPALGLAALGLVIGSWAASIWARGQVRFLRSVGIVGLAAVGWFFSAIDTSAGWKWLAFALALHAVLWLAPGRLVSLPQALLARLVLDPRGRAARLARRRVLIVGQVSTGLALLVAVGHPDHPASIATGALLAAFWLRCAAWNRSGLGWLRAGVVLATATAFAALHRLWPVWRDVGGDFVFDSDRLLLHAVLAAALAAVWYGLRRRDVLRERAGRAPVFPMRFLGAAGFGLSLVALGLLALFLLPAFEIEPTVARADHAAGAALILVLAVAYLVAARWERRPLLVFAAEACLAGFFFYVRITFPWLYRTELFRRFWPLSLVGVSYGATLLERWLERVRGARIYLGPLRTTGLILPVGPFVGVWFRPEIDATLITTLGAIAGFYAMVAYLHRSTFFAYVSTAVANATMITWAHKLRWEFTVHPQIFLWPVGLSLLGIAQVQRAVLPAAAVQALRGIGACILYASMATAIFTDAAHQNLEMILLAIAAVAGLTAGIGLKIRAFLYAGLGFLTFDVGYMVFRAGREDAWIWWMAGIVLGVGVMLAFALFEKRKQDVERWVRVLKTWQ